MKILGNCVLDQFVQQHPDAENAVKALLKEVLDALWQNPNELKAMYGNASILSDGCVIFNICGNKYRAVVKIDYQSQILRIRWAGTHKDYDKLDIRGTKCLSSK
ncbi:MAG TPA: type II toxin-antitoxin system HigB family toxin [Candidatus Cloacimonadota bacterium]|nr:type II toxin-antitoxin system HigB family toxin [Candidatus Cloacimonadota bacterium]